jgi:hypothetical protein
MTKQQRQRLAAEWPAQLQQVESRRGPDEPDWATAPAWGAGDICLRWTPLAALTERDQHQQRYCPECRPPVERDKIQQEQEQENQSVQRIP